MRTLTDISSEPDCDKSWELSPVSRSDCDASWEGGSMARVGIDEADRHPGEWRADMFLVRICF